METAIKGTPTTATDPDTATFTKWMVGEGPEMAGVVGGAAGEGAFAGKVLDFNPGPTTLIEARYGFNGSSRPFTALVHVEQTGLEADVNFKVVKSFTAKLKRKGSPVKGRYSEIKCDHDGTTTDCWQGTLEIVGDV